MRCFAYALRGFVSAIETERNMRVHMGFAFYVVICGLITRLAPWEWAAALVCIAMVLAAECLNTALERLCDELHPGRSDGIARVKDASAGAVLVCAALSAVVGGVIFFRAARFRAVLDFCADKPVLAAILIAAVPAWTYFIFFWRKKKHDK